MRLTAYTWTLWSPSFHKRKSLHVVIPVIHLWESCMMRRCCLKTIPSHSCQNADGWLQHLPFWNPFGLFVGTVALEEDAQILRVIEAYCTGASLHQNTTGLFSLLSLRTAPQSSRRYQSKLPGNLCAAVRKECVPQVLLPEEEKIIVEEMKSNGQTVIEEK